MKVSELKAGRTFGATFDHGDDFMSSLASFCRDNDVRQGDRLVQVGRESGHPGSAHRYRRWRRVAQIGGGARVRGLKRS